MPITQYNSSVRQMSQSKFNSMKNASGKIPDLANQIVMTNSEDVNISCLRTKVLWTNQNPNTSFKAQNITLSDGNYEYLEVILRATTGINRQYSVKIKKGNGANFLTYYVVTWSPYNYDQFRTADYISDTEYSISDNYRRSTDKSDIDISNDQNIPIEIIGYYKTPSMIYTGHKLFAGNGISLNNGIISQKQRCSVNISGFNSVSYSSPGGTTEGVVISGTFTKYDEASSLLISYASSSFYVTGGGSAYCNVSIDDINVEHSDVITNSSNETHSISKTVIATNISAGTHSFKWTCWSDASNRKANIAAYNTYSIAIQEI